MNKIIHTAIPLTWRYIVNKSQQLTLLLTAFIDIWTLISRSVRNADAISDCIFCSDATNLLDRIDDFDTEQRSSLTSAVEDKIAIRRFIRNPYNLEHIGMAKFWQSC